MQKINYNIFNIIILLKERYLLHVSFKQKCYIYSIAKFYIFVCVYIAVYEILLLCKQNTTKVDKPKDRDTHKEHNI